MNKINKALIPQYPGIKKDIQIVRLKKETVSELHAHDCIQILQILKGYGEVITEDGKWVIPQNQGILIPPGKAHYLEFKGSVETNNIFINSIYYKNLSSNDCFVFNLSNLLREIIDYVSKLKNCHQITEMDRRLIFVLIDQIDLNRFLKSHFYIPSPQDLRLRKLCDLILKNMTNKISLPTLCKACGLSSRTALRLFKKETQLSLNTWLSYQRILKGMNLIISGHNITYAALEVGFGTPSSYTRAFKKLMGISPKAFMKG